MRSGGCDVVSLYVLCCSINGHVCFVCLTVFVNCLVKQFAICLSVFAILLLNVMELLSVVGGALLGRVIPSLFINAEPYAIFYILWCPPPTLIKLLYIYNKNYLIRHDVHIIHVHCT